MACKWEGICPQDSCLQSWCNAVLSVWASSPRRPDIQPSGTLGGRTFSLQAALQLPAPSQCPLPRSPAQVALVAIHQAAGQQQSQAQLQRRQVDAAQLLRAGHCA